MAVDFRSRSFAFRVIFLVEILGKKKVLAPPPPNTMIDTRTIQPITNITNLILSNCFVAIKNC